ncbi:MAG: hypothetical protein JWL77_2763 [Chthonomonadaceae bacterium]|nr:hypothetical protein [Chthonomonadaceae bacterium]
MYFDARNLISLCVRRNFRRRLVPYFSQQDGDIPFFVPRLHRDHDRRPYIIRTNTFVNGNYYF